MVNSKNFSFLMMLYQNNITNKMKIMVLITAVNYHALEPNPIQESQKLEDEIVLRNNNTYTENKISVLFFSTLFIHDQVLKTFINRKENVNNAIIDAFYYVLTTNNVITINLNTETQDYT